MATEPTLVRRVVAVLIVAFAVQAGLTLAAYFDLGMQSLSHVVRVYASGTGLARGTTAVRVVVLDGASGLRATDTDVRVVGPFSEPVVYDADHSFHVAHFVADQGYAEWGVVVDAPALGRRLVPISTHVGDGSDWLRTEDTWRREPSPRAPNHSVGSDEGPELEVVVPNADKCGHHLSVASNGGVVAVGLENELYFRLTEASGGPVARATLRVSDPDGSAFPGEIVAETNSLGVARLSLSLEANEILEARFTCGDVDGLREVRITPSWDGMILRPTAPSYGPATQFGVLALHQREQGDWHMDVWCDEAWVGTVSSRIVRGAATLGLPELGLVPRADGVRLCLVQGYRYMLSPDPPRSVAWFIVRDGDVGASSAVVSLARAGAEFGEEGLRERLGPATLAALENAPPNDVDLFGRWLLSVLPHPFLQWPLSIDDAPSARDEFETRQANQQTTLVLALSLDAVVLFIAVFGFVIPVARRQRARLRSAMVELDLDEDDGLIDESAYARGLLLVGACTLFASLLGIAVLLFYLR